MQALKYFLSIPVFTLVITAMPAQAATSDAAGVPNFHKINEKVYRGAQPSDEGWQTLARLGIKTVIDLRRPDEHGTEAEAAAVRAAGMRYVNIPMKGIVAPTDAQVSKVLALFDSPEAGPVFVHCRRGADRTGTVIACYRMSHDGWKSDRALKEAKSLGMSWMEFGMRSYVRSYQPATVTAGTSRAEPTVGLP